MTTRLLWHSNAPFTPTGYGQQTGLFLPLLAEHYDVACSAFYGLEGAPITWNDIPVFPGMGGGNYGDEFLVQHAQYFFDGDPRAGLVLTLMDVWVLNPTWASKVNMACWVPVDHDPAPRAVKAFFTESGAVPIAMSRFGAEMLDGLDPLYVPHGIDTHAYTPQDRDAVRKTAGFDEDTFVVGMVAANKGRPSRKGFAQAFQAFAKFSETHDNAVLYLHTMVNPGLAGGEDIPALLQAVGIPEDKVRVCSQYRALFAPHTQAEMAQLYTAMDVLLSPSLGEGFGIPVLEAQACGTPAIVTDFSAMREVCGAGWHVKHSPFWTGLNSWQATPDVDDIVSALEDCASLPADKRAKLSRAAVKHAAAYDVRLVLDRYMLPALRESEKRFADRQPVRLRAAA